MSNSDDITKASERLQLVLSKLANSLDPLLTRVSQLEQAVNEGQQFNEDRARLARELDVAQASAAELNARETQIKQLARETRSELDRTISEIRGMMKTANGEG